MPTMTTAAPADSSNPLRFPIGARDRDTGVFYDTTKVMTAASQSLDEAAVPPGDWLKRVAVLVDVTTAGNAAAVALQADAPWSLFAQVDFLDAAGNTVQSYSGYNWFLINLLGGYSFQTDPTGSPYYTALTTGAGATAGSGSFLLEVPIEIINRELIGAYPNAASNAVTRVKLTLAQISAVYSTAPTNAPSVRVRMVSTGAVMPATTSAAGRPFAAEPQGAGTFQQWTQLLYNVNAGITTTPLTRKGNVFRNLIFVSRVAGARTDTNINTFRFSVDDVASIRGPWKFCRDRAWRRNLVTAAALPVGVLQVDYCSEWDSKVGGEARDNWVLTAPGTRVEMEHDVVATGTIEVITNEIVAAPGVLRV